MTESEQRRVAALEFVGQINRGVNPTPNGFKNLMAQVKDVEEYIKWGRLPQ